MIRTVLCLAAMLGIWLNPLPVAATVSDAGPPGRASVVGDRRQACVGRCDEHRPLFRSVPTSRWDRRRRCEHDRLRAVAPAHRHHGPESAADPHHRQRRRPQLAPRSTGTAREDCGGSVGARSAPLHRTRLSELCSGSPSAIPSSGSRPVATGASRSTKAALESPGICWMPAASPTQWEPMTTMSASSAVRGSSKSAAFAIRLWVSRPDGSWRATLRSLAVNIQIDEKLFAPCARCRPMTRVLAVLLAAVLAAILASETATVRTALRLGIATASTSQLPSQPWAQDSMQFVAWDDERWTAWIRDDKFELTPRAEGRWQHHANASLAFTDWEGKPWQAKIEGQQFLLAYRGDWKGRIERAERSALSRLARSSPVANRGTIASLNVRLELDFGFPHACAYVWKVRTTMNNSAAASGNAWIPAGVHGRHPPASALPRAR